MLIILAIIYVIFISLGLPDSLMGVVWPVMHVEFSLPESFASIISVIVGCCTGGVSIIAGPLIRKFGTAKVSVFSTLLTVIGLVGISFSPNIVFVIIFSVILGYGAGAIDTGLNSFVSVHYKASQMNFLHCFWGIGVTLSPLIMSAFLSGENDNWRNGYRTVALIQLFIAIFAAFFIKKWNKIEREKTAEIEAETETEKKSAFDIIKIKGVITAILSLGFYCSMEFLIGTWGATFAVNVFSLTPAEAAKWVSLYYGGIMFGRLVSGFVSMKLSDNKMIRFGLFFSILGIAFLILPIGKNALLGLFLIGFGFGPIFPSVLHIVPERFGAAYAADITGFHMGGAYLIGFLSQILFGFIATRTTFKIMPFVLLGLGCLLTFFHEFTNKKIKKEAE